MKSWIKALLYLVSLLLTLGAGWLIMDNGMKNVLSRDCRDKICSDNQQLLRKSIKNPTAENQEIICRATQSQLDKTGFWLRTNEGILGFLDNSDHFLITVLGSMGILFLIVFVHFIILMETVLWRQYLLLMILSISFGYVSIDLFKEYRTLGSKKVHLVKLSCKNSIN